LNGRKKGKKSTAEKAKDTGKGTTRERQKKEIRTREKKSDE
jgi:hypothetical protein